MEKTFLEKIIAVQVALKAPKKQYNKFGQYYYRNCEDILEAAKPLLAEQGLLLTICDEITGDMNGKRIYVKATATITDGKDKISNIAYAREADTKKGMDESQITGATSSYARKYALNGLFLIDDVKDSDFSNDNKREEEKTETKFNANAAFKKVVEMAEKKGLAEEQLKKHALEKFGKTVDKLTHSEMSNLWSWANEMDNKGN